MKNPGYIPHKIFDLSGLVKQVSVWKFLGKKVGFTNGCFDILHPGHIASLSEAARDSDMLVVALNSDASVKRLKGEGRPVNDQDTRSLLMASLLMVDAVVVFDEVHPVRLVVVVNS